MYKTLGLAEGLLQIRVKTASPSPPRIQADIAIAMIFCRVVYTDRAWSWSVLKFHSTPSTTDSTPITRACSSVGGATDCLMFLLVAARARIAARFAESLLLFGQFFNAVVAETKQFVGQPLVGLLNHRGRGGRSCTHHRSGVTVEGYTGAEVIFSCRPSTQMCGTVVERETLFDSSIIQYIAEVSMLTLSCPLAFVRMNHVRRQSRTFSKPFLRSLPQHGRRASLQGCASPTEYIIWRARRR